MFVIARLKITGGYQSSHDSKNSSFDDGKKTTVASKVYIVL